MNGEEYICYTGIGSRKSGKHTKKQFLDIMKKSYKSDCARYVKGLKCKSCKKSNELDKKITRKYILAQKKNRTYKMSSKTMHKLLRATEKCYKCKNANNKLCTLSDYMLFSGAENGMCK